MEQLLARRAALRRQLFARADEGVADGALGLAFERARDVLTPGGETVRDGAVLIGKLAFVMAGSLARDAKTYSESDDTLRIS